MTTSLIVEVGTSSETFLMGWEVWTSLISGIVTLLILSYKFGYFKGKQETCHEQYQLGTEKGKDISCEKSFKKGVSQGMFEYKKKIIEYNKVSCIHNRLGTNTFTNGITIFKTVDGEFKGIECPFLEKENICQNTNQLCVKVY